MTTYVVLGCHRSGTSLVAQMLSRMGVHMGDRLLRGNQWNPHGHWEDADVVKLNDTILKAAGGSWSQPPLAAHIVAVAPKFRGVIAQLVEQRSAHDRWGWKDPRTCLTAPVYHELLEDARYIVVRRTRADMVRSLLKRAHEASALLRAELAAGERYENALLQLLHGTWKQADWKRLVDEYERRARVFLQVTKAPALRVWYENLMGSDARMFVERLARFCESDEVDEAMQAIARE